MLGSKGSLGSAIVNERSSSGKPVRALVRSPAKASNAFAHPDKVELVEGSVEDSQKLERAFDGVEVFHNCVNAPYSNWSTLTEIHGRITGAASTQRHGWSFRATYTPTVTAIQRRSAKITQGVNAPIKGGYGSDSRTPSCGFPGRARFRA